MLCAIPIMLFAGLVEAMPSDGDVHVENVVQTKQGTSGAPALFGTVTEVHPYDTALGSPDDARTQGRTPAMRPTDARAEDAVYVRDYGAKCDGKTDDAAAINSAFDFVRSLLHREGGAAAAAIVFPQGVCLVRSSINATMLRSKSILIKGEGTAILGKVVGKPVVDALGSQFLRIRDLTIIGDRESTPDVGLRVGRTAPTSAQEANDINVDSVAITGYFKFAALYNLNAESSSFYKLVVVNAYASGSAYGVVMDGLNHFNAKSEFVAVTQPVDTAQSFNENVFLSADIRCNGPGIPVWMGMTTRHRWISSYLAAVGGRTGVVLFSNSSADSNSYLDFDVHVETDSIDNTFLLSGKNPAPVLAGFKFRDQRPSGKNSIFVLDREVTSAKILGGDLVIGTQRPQSKVFDAPSAWSMSGRVFVGYAPGWNLPARNFSGTVDLAGLVTHSGGVVLGVPGASGSPIAPSSAIMDGTASRQTLTGAPYTVPRNVGLVRFVQTARVGEQTVVLPQSLGDGHLIQFVNYSAAIDALTFSPAVHGWTNGSVLSANTGLRVRWDAGDSTWHREQ